MRRWARYASNALALASAVLCACAATLWVRTPSRSLFVDHSFGSARVNVIAGEGWASLSVRRSASGETREDVFFYSLPHGKNYYSAVVRSRLYADGVGARSNAVLPRVRWNSRGTTVLVPEWLLVLAFGVLPAARALRWWRCRRMRHTGGFPVEPSVYPQSNP